MNYIKLLANENIPFASIFYLREMGFDILSIGMNCPSIKDSEIMEIAIREDRAIITFDRDYGELIFRHNYKPQKGVIYLRLTNYTPEEPAIILENLFRSSLNFDNALTVVDHEGIRQRKY